MRSAQNVQETKPRMRSMRAEDVRDMPNAKVQDLRGDHMRRVWMPKLRDRTSGIKVLALRRSVMHGNMRRDTSPGMDGPGLPEDGGRAARPQGTATNVPWDATRARTDRDPNRIWNSDRTSV